jgi:uncharacterized membrane protein
VKCRPPAAHRSRDGWWVMFALYTFVPLSLIMIILHIIVIVIVIVIVTTSCSPDCQ